METSIPKPLGNLLGLKKSHINQLERVYRRKLRADEVASWELVKFISGISTEIRREVGVIANRKGEILSVIVGEHHSLSLSKLTPFRQSPGRLSGLRFIHTRFGEEGVSQRDENELGNRRLDLLAVVSIDEAGNPGRVHVAHLRPGVGKGEKPMVLLEPAPYPDLQLQFDEFIRNLEEELARFSTGPQSVKIQNRAFLCALKNGDRFALEENLQETRELATSMGLEIVETFLQHRDKPDPKFLFGEGKLQEVLMQATAQGVSTLLFQQNVSANQGRHLADISNLTILDRTQVILEIFARRARTHEGKLQVELAQLRYLLPRLRERGQQLSRLVGGIGGRGPGETKFEEHRRRAKERMNRLEKEILLVAKNRAKRRNLRQRKNVPVVSIVGYTNAGKTTLLNSLTNAGAFTENKPFATLDPFSKRLRFPHEHEVILTDTVGFIRDLPADLYFAFRATLEEISEADLLLHVVDVSKEDFEERIRVVGRILGELGSGNIPEILVFNKADLLGPQVAQRIGDMHQAVAISATEPQSCRHLLHQMEALLWKKTNARENARPTSQINSS